MEYKTTFEGIILLLLMLLSGCKQENQCTLGEIWSLQELDVFTHDIDSSTLVILDIDDTLIESSCNMTQHDHQEYHQIIKKLLTPNSIFNSKQKQAALIYKILPNLIEEYAPLLVEQLQRKGIKVIALTLGSKIENPRNVIDSYSSYRVESLKKLGLDFSSSFKKYPHLVLNDIGPCGDHPLFKQGILFAAPCTKAQALESFLAHVHWKPKRIVSIDNDKSQILKLMLCAYHQGIKYHGLHYRGAQQLDPFDLELFKFKVDHLITHDEWLTDEHAEMLYT